MQHRARSVCVARHFIKEMNTFSDSPLMIHKIHNFMKKDPRSTKAHESSESARFHWVIISPNKGLIKTSEIGRIPGCWSVKFPKKNENLIVMTAQKQVRMRDAGKGAGLSRKFTTTANGHPEKAFLAPQPPSRNDDEIIFEFRHGLNLEPCVVRSL